MIFIVVFNDNYLYLVYEKRKLNILPNIIISIANALKKIRNLPKKKPCFILVSFPVYNKQKQCPWILRTEFSLSTYVLEDHAHWLRM